MVISVLLKIFTVTPGESQRQPVENVQKTKEQLYHVYEFSFKEIFYYLTHVIDKSNVS